MISVLDRALRYVAKCEPAISGQGGHDRTFHVAAVAVHGFALDDADALAVLREYNQRCVPPWSETELVHKVRSTATAQHALARGHLLKEHDRGTDFKSQISDLKVSRPASANLVSPRAAAERFLNGFRCHESDLTAESPVALDGEPRFDGVLALANLYKPDERINFVTEFEETTVKGEIKARPVGKGLTLTRDEAMRRFAEVGTDSSRAGGWLRMNPVDGYGIADANVAAFRFALLESDALPMDLQVSLIARLPLPVSLVVSSGGRSVHAWVRIDAGDIAEYRATVSKMLKILARLGVDEKNKNPSRLSRLPGAKREIGGVGDGWQKILYLNPNPAERRICP